MVKIFRALIIFFALSAATLSAAHATEEFSARLVMSSKGSAPVSGRIFVKGDKVRQETSGPDGTQIMVFRPDKKVTWLITGGGQVCLQMPYQASDNDFEQWQSIKATNSQFLGKETVCGLPCSKYQGAENGNETVFWIFERFSFPVKVDNQDKTIEYTDVRQSTLDDSLFEIPPACKKATIRIEPP